MPQVDNTYKLRNQEFLQEYAQKPGVAEYQKNRREIQRLTNKVNLIRALRR